MRPTARLMMSHPAHFISLGFGSGLSPWAPGTMGTLLAWALYPLIRTPLSEFVFLALLASLGACATRPVNPPLAEARLGTGYTYETRQKYFKSKDNLVILAFSGGGTRAASFSYGVLEFLRQTRIADASGRSIRRGSLPGGPLVSHSRMRSF